MCHFLYRHQENILASNDLWIPIFANLSDTRYDAFWFNLELLVFSCANATMRDELMPTIVVLDKFFQTFYRILRGKCMICLNSLLEMYVYQFNFKPFGMSPMTGGERREWPEWVGMGYGEILYLGAEMGSNISSGCTASYKAGQTVKRREDLLFAGKKIVICNVSV